jgi:hypothetical protein
MEQIFSELVVVILSAVLLGIVPMGIAIVRWVYITKSRSLRQSHAILIIGEALETDHPSLPDKLGIVLRDEEGRL